jgi:NAD-specific glutamate dehydrogenase
LSSPVRHRCGGRLPDDAEDLETSANRSSAGRFDLEVVVARRNGHDRLAHDVVEMSFAIGFELLKDEDGEVFWAVSTVVDDDLVLDASQQMLERPIRSSWVRHGLTFRRSSHQHLTTRCEGDDGRDTGAP